MMRVDVDFNERDRNGHVVARVLGVQLAAGQKVYLYDPLERIWADAVVARVNPETSIAAFEVDWHSFADAEVADVSDPHGHWTIGVSTTSSGHQQDGYAASCTGFPTLPRSGWRIVVTAQEGPPLYIESPASSNSAEAPHDTTVQR